MNETSLSLLDQLRNSSETDHWNRLVEIYTPLLRIWLRKYDVQESDANDLLQEVLLAVSKDLKDFSHNGQPGAFRNWMKTILVNRLRKFWRTRDRNPQAKGDSDIDQRLQALDDPTSQATLIWNQQHDQYVLKQLLALVEPQFESSTWQAFCRVALDGEKPDVVARELEISRNAVIIAKCRVLSRLRQEADGLVASSSAFLANS